MNREHLDAVVVVALWGALSLGALVLFGGAA